MASKERTKCATVIPSHWPALINPISTGNVAADVSAWYRHLRTLEKVTPTPKVFGKSKSD